jgi:hypothetical protein
MVFISIFIFCYKTEFLLFTGQSYLQFLKDNLPEIKEDLPLAIRRKLTFMQDGAPPHYSLAVRNYLDTEFPNNWIGRGGPIPWPPRSPDITPMDYFIWGFWKDLVYKEPVRDINQLRERILNTAPIIREKIREMDFTEGLVRRLEECTNVNGGYFEPRL